METVIGSLNGVDEYSNESLSFVGSRQDLWQPKRTGTYGQDCEVGRFYASELAEFVRVTGRVTVLPHICKAIADCGQWDGVEIGFFTAIGIAFAEAG